MNEDELKKQQDDLAAKEAELKEREDDAAKIGATIKEEYEKKLEALKADYEARLASREEIIRQLASGENDNSLPSPFEDLNKRRKAQKSA